MSDSIINGFSEMKDIYLTQILTEGKDYDGDGKVEDPKKEWKDSKNNAIRKALGKPPEDDYEPEDEEDDEDEEDKDEKPKSKRKHKKDEEKDDEMKTESFSNWRSDLYEVISKLEPKVKEIDNDEPISEKKVVNKVVLNPVVTEKFTLIGEQELDEEFLLETSSVAAEYFANLGLNEHGLEMVIDYLGKEKFLEYVFYVTEDYLLTEARRSGRIEPVTKTGKQISSLKGGAKSSSIKAKRKEKAARREAEEMAQASKPSGLKAALKSQSEVAKKVTKDKGDRTVKAAAEQQPKGRTNKDKLAAGILSLISGAQKQYQQGMERHRAVTGLASQTAQTGAKVVGTIAKGVKEFGGGMVSGGRMATGLETSSGKETKLGRKAAAASIKGTRAVTRSARDVVARQVGRTKAQANESVHYIMEKAVSEQQQKIFGLALAVKRGEVSRSKVSEKVLEIADSMSEAEIRKFASTKHKGIPHRK